MSAEVAAQWQRIDEDNTQWLADVVSAWGWPGRTMADQDGAAAAWLLAQHADRDPARQQTFLDALRGAAGRGEASLAHLAYLKDRSGSMPDSRSCTAPSSSKPTAKSGRTLEDLQRLDERRAEAGLEPFADYEARMRTQS